MLRVFTIASKKCGVAPYFSCLRWRVDIKVDSNKKLNSKDRVHQSHIPGPPDPAKCCGSGCVNCVWIEYVIELMDYYNDRPLHEVLDGIDKVVSNVGLREFIKSEIHARAKCR